MVGQPSGKLLSESMRQGIEQGVRDLDRS